MVLKIKVLKKLKMRFSGRDPLPWNTMALTYFIPAPLFAKRLHCFENLDSGADL